MQYYIADLHLGHKNVLKFDNRPFDTIEENDNAIIQNWNNKINDNDDIWVLGDISWYNPKKTVDIYNNLKGRKHLIIGNHDKSFVQWIKNKHHNPFCEITPYKELKTEKMSLVLCHYPIPLFNKHHYGTYHLYGHVHNTYEWNLTECFKKQVEETGNPCNMMNVGCMMPYMNYEPKTFEEIMDGYTKWSNNKNRK